jgi:glycerate-2-kinase
MIKNLNKIANSTQRKKILKILDFGLEQTRTSTILKNSIKLNGDILTVQKKAFNLKKSKRIFVLGIGKASGEACQYLEKLLGERLTKGYCIDIQKRNLNTIKFSLGSHPHSSKKNFEFTKEVVTALTDLAEDDLVITVISGGGSALFVYPFESECITQVDLFKKLTKKGANIKDINTVRKHLSLVKGGGLAKIIFPAKIISLIFSDVPGDDLTTIASGPLAKDPTTPKDAKKILEKYKIKYDGEFLQTPKGEKYFKNILNFLVCSSSTTLLQMQKKAEELKINSKIFKVDFQADADEAGKILLEKTNSGELLLAGGETTVKIKGSGKGGRNQQVVLSALQYLKENELIISCASDGHDYTEAAGAIGDSETIRKAEKLKLDPEKFRKNNNSFNFFLKTKDHIITGPTGINVSDIFLIYKK